jgi:raffinose/stachyose/melibiose transport system permease protein
LFLILATLITLIPIWLILIGSVKPEDEIYTNIFGLPKKLVFENFIDAWLYGNFQVYYKNSVIISLFSTVFILALSACAGFVLSRRDLLFKKAIIAFFLVGIIIPIQIPVMPLFVEIKNFGLYNKLQGMVVIFVGFRIAFTTVIFSRFMRQVPAEIEEAALIDGCSVWQDFIRIVLPLSTNVLCVGGILNAVYSWNNFFFPMVFISSNSFKPLPSGLMAFKGENTIMFTKLFAAITIVTIPIIIVYLLMQKYFVQGITAGAVKG